MENIEVFNRLAKAYNNWFELNSYAYRSEILAVQKFLPKNGLGLEVGVGTGRFAAPCGIKMGVEPARAMADKARARGIEVCQAEAEKLPFPNGVFDFILMVTVICFLKDPLQALREVKRVLKPQGQLIIAMIDKESPLGRAYELRKNESEFYRGAHFYSVDQVRDWLASLKFEEFRICQTIFNNTQGLTGIETVKDGYGHGVFAVISVKKPK